MPWTSPADWVVGEIPAASKLNSNLRDNMKMLWYEVDYAEITTPATVTATLEASPQTLITGNTITIAAVPTLAEFFCPYVTLQSGEYCIFQLAESGARTKLAIAECATVTGAQDNRAVFGSIRFNPSAGSRTWSITAYGSGSVEAGAGTAAPNEYVPAYMRILQRGG
jgi:hypothetical protein